MSKIGQGTATLAAGDRDRAIAALRAGLEAGSHHVDTAEMYGRGAVEELVGEAISGRRDEVFLVSKVMPSHAGYEDTVRACERSLQRLGTDRLDLYLLHAPSRQYPFAETLAALDKLQRDGKILRFGVSNFDADQLTAAVGLAGEGAIACNQVLYHLEERSIEHAIAPCSHRHGVAVVGYSPFGSGSFPGPDSPGGRVLQAVADRHGATARQVALAFLVRDEGVFSIPRSSDPEHARQNARAGSLELSPDDLRQIDDAFPLGPPQTGAPML